MFETEIKYNLNCRSKFIVDIQDCKFRLEINKDYEEEVQEIIEEILNENRESIEAWVKEWKESGVEKVIDYKVLNGKIFLVKRCYSLNFGEIKYRQRDLGYEILINSYVKDKDYIKAIENDFILYEVV